MLKFVPFFVCFVLNNFGVFGQEAIKEFYTKTFIEQHKMLKGEIPVDFKWAVFNSENSYYQGKLNYEDFKSDITKIGFNLKKFIIESEMTSYKTAGNWAVFTFMTEALEINNNQAYTYDFEDYFGEKDMSKMFVSKLMNSKTGNCHSLPYLYKIICDELGVSSNLAISPNHVFVKHINEYGKWVNVELTSASFPEDKYLIKESGLPIKAIENKIYLQALSDKETIALSIFDLSNYYDSQFGMDTFYISIIDTALIYFPNGIPLLLNKANYYHEKISQELNKSSPNQTYLNELVNNYAIVNQKINDLGHQEISDKLNEKWIKYMEKEKKKHDKKKKLT